MCQKSKDMFANAVFLPNIPKLDQKNHDQTTMVRRSLPSQMEVQVRKGGRHHHRTKVSKEQESISNRFDGKVTKGF